MILFINTLFGLFLFVTPLFASNLDSFTHLSYTMKLTEREGHCSVSINEGPEIKTNLEPPCHFIRPDERVLAYHYPKKKVDRVWLIGGTPFTKKEIENDPIIKNTSEIIITPI